MQEEFLHYIWKYKKFRFTNAKTTAGEEVVLIAVGIHNQNSGPDFFNARLKIGEQLWAGNVEIHIKASDWYFHQHETDKNYDNVILHVVWEHDVDVFRQDNSVIPCLALKSLVEDAVLENYKSLISRSSGWINCENDFGGFSDFQVGHWLERIYFERLEEKSVLIEELLEKSGNNWEATFFKLLAKNFGLNVNGDAFLSMANSFEYKTLQKIRQDKKSIEALLFGQAGFLEKNSQEAYFIELKEEYVFLRHKFALDNAQVIPPKYFRLRPGNFPNIRLSQLAGVYHKNAHLFSEVISASKISSLYEIFDVKASQFWETHYNFGKAHKKRRKGLSRNFIHLLIINTIIPLKFAYSRHQGNPEEENLAEVMREIKAEENGLVEKFVQLRPEVAVNAMDSQALIHLKKNYCDKNKCLHCGLGNTLLQKNTL